MKSPAELIAELMEATPVQYTPWTSAGGAKPGKRKRRHRNKIARRERARQAKQRG